MTTTLETVHKDLVTLKKDVAYIKSLLAEDFELSDEAKAALTKARSTPESEYLDLQ